MRKYIDQAILFIGNSRYLINFPVVFFLNLNHLTGLIFQVNALEMLFILVTKIFKTELYLIITLR